MAAGFVAWPSGQPIWRFDWSLTRDVEGVVLRHVFLRGQRVFWKASLPSLRVQYDPACGSCGPYKDPLSEWDAFEDRCPGQKVCIYEYTGSSGLRTLAVEGYYQIGAYRLRQRWLLREDGRITPRLYSAGLQHPFHHNHHVYWRLDFDIDGWPNDSVWEWDPVAQDWSQLLVEGSRTKGPSATVWAVMDLESGRGYHIHPGADDGHPDDFSRADLWFTRWHGTEDRMGNQGSPTDDALDRDLSGESLDGQDVMVWYCGHLEHHVEHGADEWHATGPILVPFGPW